MLNTVTTENNYPEAADIIMAHFLRFFLLFSSNLRLRPKLFINTISIYLSIYSCCSHLGHTASLKRFVSLQFLNLRQSAGIPRQGIRPTQGRYVYRTTSTERIRHLCLQRDSKSRSQSLSGRIYFMPQTLWLL
jgi:hypothetical protein